MRKRGDRVWCRRRVVHGRERWQVVVVIGGSQNTFVYPTRAEAERQVAIVSAGLKAGEHETPASWADAIDAFEADRKARGTRASTRQTYRFRLEAVGRWLGDVDPLTLTEAQGRRYAAEHTGSPATLRGELDAVTILQRWMVAQGWMPAATWAGVPRPSAPASKRHLRPDQVGAFLRAAERLGVERDWPRWPAAAWLLLHGLRRGEMHRLKVGDLDLVTGVVYVEDRADARTKSEASVRGVPILSARALACLRATYRDRPASEPAFFTGRGKTSAARPNKWLNKRVAETCAAAEIDPPVTPHELRHTVATAAVVAGADVHSVQHLLGHADARVTSRTYTHALAAVRARGAAQAVGSFLDRIVEAKAALEVVS